MSRRTRNLHCWKTRTDEGEKREIEAQLFGSQWRIRSRIAGEDEWTDHDEPSLEDLTALEEILFNKYQRKHGNWDHLQSVRKLIERLQPED